MPFLAGQIITAGQLARMQPTPYMAAATSALTTTTTTYADIPGTDIAVTTLAANATYTALGVFDCNVLGTSPSILMVGRLLVDGATDVGLAIHAMDTLDRDTVSMVWQGVLPAAGAHTFKLQGALTAALASGGSFLQSDTRLQVTITEVV